MPVQQSVTFEELHAILEQYKDHHAPLMYNMLTDVLDHAYDMDDSVMIQGISWAIFISYIGMKSPNEIIQTLRTKIDACQTEYRETYNQLINNRYQFEHVG